MSPQRIGQLCVYGPTAVDHLRRRAFAALIT